MCISVYKEAHLFGLLTTVYCYLSLVMHGDNIGFCSWLVYTRLLLYDTTVSAYFYIEGIWKYT